MEHCISSKLFQMFTQEIAFIMQRSVYHYTVSASIDESLLHCNTHGLIVNCYRNYTAPHRMACQCITPKGYWPVRAICNLGPCITTLIWRWTLQSFQPMAAQLSMKAALPLAKGIATASCRRSDTGPCAYPWHCSHLWWQAERRYRDRSMWTRFYIGISVG